MSLAFGLCLFKRDIQYSVSEQYNFQKQGSYMLLIPILLSWELLIPSYKYNFQKLHMR